MIYVFSGNDIDKRTLSLEKLLKNFSDREVFRLDDLDFSENTLENFVSGADLFSKKFLVILDSMLETNLRDIIISKVKDLEVSDTVFIFLEKDILKDAAIALKKHAEKFEEFDLPKLKDSRFNIFQITDAFGARDKKNSWVLLQKALRDNISSEEVLNILIWQVKNLLFVKKETDAKKTGLNPFVFSKSKKYSENFQEEELNSISRDLIKLFHESHLGLNLESNLELFILKSL